MVVTLTLEQETSTATNPSNSIRVKAKVKATLSPMKPTMEPSSTKSTPSKRATAETAMAEIMGSLSTIAPGAEILLVLKTLCAGETVLIQLIEVRRGRGRASTAQLTLRAGFHATFHTCSPGLRLEVLRLGARLYRVPRAVIPLRPAVVSVAVDVTVRPGIDVTPRASDDAARLATRPLESCTLSTAGRAESSDAALRPRPAPGLD